MAWWRRRDENAGIDPERVRAAVAAIVESSRFDAWLDGATDEVLLRIAAPLEVLVFHYHLQPRKDRHVVRAARVAWEAMQECLPACPDDMAAAFRGLGDALTPGEAPAEPARGR